MAHRRLPHLISYDIAQPKRLSRVHRYLKKFALPLQYSVFLVEADAAKIEKILQHLKGLIHAREDDVRVYPLPNEPEWSWLGKPLWGEGVQVTDLKVPTALRFKVDVVVTNDS